MRITPLKFILILCHARTGGTWLGQLFDTCPNVKYLWEPDAPQHHLSEHLPAWNLDDPVELWCRTYLFRNHLEIKPHFPKTVMDTAVIKEHTALGDMRRHSVKWTWRLVEKIRKGLDAKVIHLVRHPTRWTASMLRWMPPHMSYPSQELYATRNRECNEHFQGEPWYRMVRHEDLIRDHSLILEMVRFCGLEPSPALKMFLNLMHSEDLDVSKKERTTVMTVGALTDRWRGMSSHYIEQAEKATAEHWGWAGYTPLMTEVGPR